MGELKSARRRPRRWVRITLVALGFVALAAATGGVGLYRITDARLQHRYDTGFAPPLANGDSVRGRHLATAVTLCVKCHAADFGGQVMADNAVLRLAAPNLTRGKGGRSANWSDDDWERAIRHGIRPDGRPLLVMPADAYAWLSDRDLAALIAYLRTRRPVDRDFGRSYLKLPGRMLMAAGKVNDLAAERIDHSRSLPVYASQTDGAYLARIAGCTMCHQADLSGRATPIGPPGAPRPPAINQLALRGWTLVDFERVLRTGRRPDGTPVSTFMPWTSYAGMDDAEISALWLFILQTPAGDPPAKAPHEREFTSAHRATPAARRAPELPSAAPARPPAAKQGDPRLPPAAGAVAGATVHPVRPRLLPDLVPGSGTSGPGLGGCAAFSE